MRVLLLVLLLLVVLAVLVDAQGKGKAKGKKKNNQAANNRRKEKVRNLSEPRTKRKGTRRVKAATARKVKLVEIQGDAGVPEQFIVMLRRGLKRKRANANRKKAQRILNKAIRQSNDPNAADEWSVSELHQLKRRKYYIVNAPMDAVEQIREGTGDIDFIEQDQYVDVVQCSCPCPTTPIPGDACTGRQTYTISDEDIWGLDRIDQTSGTLDQKMSLNGTGEGVDVYVVDTGIDIGHSEFGGRAVWGTTTATNSDDADTHGHGTHVAGIVASNTYGVAKNAKVIAVKVIGDDGSGFVSWVLNGLEWIDQRIKGTNAKVVINMSIGAGGIEDALDQGVADVIESGATVVVASGNSQSDACNFSPAKSAAAITVGATDRTDEVGSFSNYGSCVDIVAPGVNIKSSIPRSNAVLTSQQLSGTSMAAPHVSGAAAVYMSTLGHTPSNQDVKSFLLSKATKNVVTEDQSGATKPLLNIGCVG